MNADWYQVETPHFRIVTNGRPAMVKDLARDLERFRAATSQLLRVRGDQQRLTVFALANRSSYAGIVGEEQARQTGGMFNHTSYGSFALVNLERYRFMREHPAREFLFHEYTHFLTYGSSPVQFPFWYSEGFAEFFSTAEFPGDGSYMFGAIPVDRANSLIHDRPMPLEDLLRATPATVDKKQRLKVYAGGWMLTHWLIMSSDKGGKIGDYIDAYNRGADPVDALTNALDMPLEDLERAYLQQAEGRFPKGKGQLPDDYRPADPQPRPMSQQRAVAEIARYMVMSGRKSESLEELVQYARAEGANSHELTSVMAVAETGSGAFERAEEILATIPADLHGEFWYRSAEAWLWLRRELQKGTESDLKQMAAVRDKFVSLINDNDEVAAHWYGLAIAMQKLGHLRGEYLEMLEQAYLRAPREGEIAWWYAHELYLDRDAESFAFVARPLLMQTSGQEFREQLQSMLADLPADGAPPMRWAGDTLGGTFSKYRDHSAYKALALAFDYRGACALGYIYGSPDQDTANERALAECESQRVEFDVETPCRVYAEGDRVVGGADASGRRL
ncbi:hypothetical protein [Microbulbifer rhizosphaerae]|uniref:Tetratricopeptide (TPR) repeat protein n=1 Tax=Microbulbifer rhizosphaerae TaxID=1562603 RepID=A0A7W4WDU7_9GAMM|nr:hypothetical protein [Microbulbifer rhizosphaerae]MBB3062432.1 tetratricopeptide (TPR) repeat protein [Microbulbifer rhizosphaerae]